MKPGTEKIKPSWLPGFLIYFTGSLRSLFLLSSSADPSSEAELRRVEERIKVRSRFFPSPCLPKTPPLSANFANDTNSQLFHSRQLAEFADEKPNCAILPPLRVPSCCRRPVGRWAKPKLKNSKAHKLQSEAVCVRAKRWRQKYLSLIFLPVSLSKSQFPDS